MPIPVGFGASEAFHALMGVQLHPNTVAYLHQEATKEMPHLLGVAQQFMQNRQQIWERSHGAEALRYARGVVQEVMGASAIVLNEVVALTTLEQLQLAPPVMIPLLMANPTLRVLYHQQRCDGYSQSYHDQQPDEIGLWHDDYRRATTGMVLERDGDQVGTWQHFDVPEPLAFDQQCSVQDSWETQNAFIQRGLDSSNPEGGTL